MKRILVTQRVTVVPTHGERRDSLDQRWVHFLFACGLLPLLVPNHLPTSRLMLEALQPDGILLTNGDDLTAYGGRVPEREEMERFLIDYALQEGIPLIGVCKGMQVIQDYFGVPLHQISGHVRSQQTVTLHGSAHEVNSYHNWGTTQTVEPLDVWGVAEDGVVKAVRVNSKEVYGIMWHPERFQRYREEDVRWFRSVYNGEREGRP